MDEFDAERRSMVKKQIARRGLREPRLLAAFESVPRHLFIPSPWRREAYKDRALPIGFGQTISQPYMVAAMTDLLALTGEERVLEVGTGSGYQAAILSRLAGQVYTIEFDPDLAIQARDLLRELGCKNVQFRLGDGSLGWPENGPFDGILVTAFASHVPQPLLDQLSDGGRLVMPVGSRSLQTLETWTRVGGHFQHNSIMPVVFVPLRGEFGWKEE
jgi:protein-L-isoaspartate(D-aspartate) O-methyltransferase